MCDYSLMGIPNRLASHEEELVVHRFHTGTIGLAPFSELHPVADTQPATLWAKVNQHLMAQTRPVCAVCIPPGAQLLLQNIPEALQSSLGTGSTEIVQFTQISAQANEHRDAVMFGNGRTVLLQRLQEGQRVRVLQLSLQDEGIPQREPGVEVPVR